MPTIGVALSIPEPWATQLQDYRTAIGDTSATMIPTHITLVPPVEVEASRLAAVEGHLSEVAAGFGSFTVQLRGTGTFRPISPVVFVTLEQGISECGRLARAVRRGPLELDLAFPYHPHVTIAHDLSDDVLDRAVADLADFECSFDVGDFHLYVHDEAAGWQPTHDFPLTSSKVA